MIQGTIDNEVPLHKPFPTAKRWWTSELSTLRKEGNRLSRHSYRHRALTDHPSHTAYKTHQTLFAARILEAKQQHWTDFLEEATERELWVANRYIKDPVGDGGRPRIPSLRSKQPDGSWKEVVSNEEKAEEIAKSFFPSKPESSSVPPECQYPEPLESNTPITVEQIERHIKALSPYKAPGLDGIPNIVLQKCSKTVAPVLAHIFTSSIENGWYHQSWKDSITCVLKKPGKPNYQVPKAYRPIALLSTTAKLLSAIVAEDMTRLIEKHQLLPNNHFGGRPGRTTTDALHYLVAKISKAWKERKVVSVLFLDVEGAFPNAVTDRVIHNMRKRRIPERYVTLISCLLEGRRTRLRFDDFLSTFRSIDNGIGQGCPLSMIIYILYNADLLEIPEDEKEDAIGYVDDAILIATGDTFEATVNTLQNMMERNGGGFEWSRLHNSKFEITKVAVMHMSRRTRRDPVGGARIKIRNEAPPLIVSGSTVTVVQEYKYLGELRWRAQAMRATEKATKWTLMFKRLTKPTTGVRLPLMRKLYLSVGIPKLTYAIDVWYTPPHKPLGQQRNSGSVTAARLMSRVQRIACLAITGALRSTATDIAEAHANIPPLVVSLQNMCRRASIRMCTIPASHPNYTLINTTPPLKPRPHESPITRLQRMFKLDAKDIEKITPRLIPPNVTRNYSTTIRATRELSMEYEATNAATVTIYTDGSGFGGGVGAAAVMYKDDAVSPYKIYRHHLGSINRHSTYEGEIVGLILAAWMLVGLGDRYVGYDEINLFVDCQSAIEAVSKGDPGPGQYLFDAFNKLTQKLDQRGQQRHQIQHPLDIGA